MEQRGDKIFKAIIRVVKSIAFDERQFNAAFDSVDVIREPIVYANDKAEVKEYLKVKYPQFFQNGKVYEKETKDQAQFFYVIIYPLYNHEIELINKGEWTCSYCNQVHENEYISRPRKNERLYGSDVMFCRTECMDNYTKNKYVGVEFPDDNLYIKVDSPTYIYKCTEKKTGKSYIGKTRNAPFWRWWNHLTKSKSPFGNYLRSTKLSDWTFEVLEELPSNMSDTDVFMIESKYIVQYDSLANGFNTVISNKNAIPSPQISLI